MAVPDVFFGGQKQSYIILETASDIAVERVDVVGRKEPEKSQQADIEGCAELEPLSIEMRMFIRPPAVELLKAGVSSRRGPQERGCHSTKSFHRAMAGR